jgi:hypothetical protein
LNDDDRIRWIAEVKFLKAFHHFWLFRMYGPIPLIKENLPLAAKGKEVQRYREPVDEVVEYITGLLDEAIVDLPRRIEDIANEMGRPTQSVALALKAQVLTYAASPLFNGNTDYASFKDNRDIHLFPQTYDAGKWQKAADALKEAIDEAHSVGIKLYDFRNSVLYLSTLNEKTVWAMQVRGAVTERWNSEIIWGDPNVNTTALQTVCFPVTPGIITSNYIGQSYAPPLHIVEQFYTENGIPIEDDKEWEGLDPMALRTSADEDKWYIQQGELSIQLHFNREARFHSSIFFDKGIFFGNGRYTSDTNPFTAVLMSPTLTIERFSSTGYLCKKLIHLTSVSTSSSTTTTRYAFPIIRLADLYLMYAEALNECTAIPNTEVYEYIDMVRARTGLEPVVDSWSKYAVDSKKNKPLTQEGMREIIRRERMNELAFEGIRFWDLKRWKLSEKYMNQTIRGFDIYQKTPEDFYQVKNVYSLKFELKDYFWPIRTSVLVKNKNLLQNPGW